MADVFDSRRRFLQKTALGMLGAAFPPLRTARKKNPAPVSAQEIKLGVASYSLRAFSRAEVIKILQELRTPYVNLKSFHLPYEYTPAELAAARAEFETAGLKIVGGGNNNITEDSDEHVRKFFDYARYSGMPLLVIAPRPEILPRIERFVKQYDIRVAIHNHGPEDPYFPGPKDALKIIKDMDARVGLCVDVGHTARTGVDVVAAIAAAGSRVLDLHMKDLKDLRAQESQCIVGEGAMPVPEIFAQLRRMNYSGYVNLEYEIDEKNPLPGMKQSFAYMRGVLAGMKI